MRQYVYDSGTGQKAYFVYGDYVYEVKTSKPVFRIFDGRWFSPEGQDMMCVRHGLVYASQNLDVPLFYVGARQAEKLDLSFQENVHVAVSTTGAI
ncbi:MAG: hypothetical protein B7Z26_05455 [Asticcacaulis sp. 32-58-5]|nr:MAG: hypothetical protein B7Z26_05455 [Asticcacaulis sp. 32-58-5]